MDINKLTEALNTALIAKAEARGVIDKTGAKIIVTFDNQDVSKILDDWKAENRELDNDEMLIKLALRKVDNTIGKLFSGFIEIVRFWK